MKDFRAQMAEIEFCAQEMRRCEEAFKSAQGISASYRAEIVEGNARIARALETSLALFQELAADFERFGLHSLPSPRVPLGCVTRERYPPSATFQIKCDCGFEEARKRWSLR